MKYDEDLKVIYPLVFVKDEDGWWFPIGEFIGDNAIAWHSDAEDRGDILQMSSEIKKNFFEKQ